MTTTDTTDQQPRVRHRKPDPEMWEDPTMRQALVAQDVTTVYRLLQKRGFSQQHIAALTGQSQPKCPRLSMVARLWRTKCCPGSPTV